MIETALNINNNLETDYPLSQEQVNQYHQNGFLQIPHFFDCNEIEPLQIAIKEDPSFRGQQTIRYDVQNRIYKMAIWTDLENSLLGVIPRLARIVDGATILIGKECYHWHSKIVTKEPGGGQLSWHQDYASWYEDGCLFPDLINCLIALSESNRKNGCLKIVAGSHLLGRLNIPVECPYRDADPHRVEKVLERLEIIECEMQPGDVLFFHGNTLHSSQPNNSNHSRNLLYCTYNAVSNEPFIKEGQEHHRYHKLNKLSDSTIKDGKYDTVFAKQKFHPPETKENQAMGVLYRRSKI